MKKIIYYFKGLIAGIDYYLEAFTYKAVQSKKYSDLAHSSKGLEAEKWEHWNRIHKDFEKSFPVMVTFFLSLMSIIISLIAIIVAVFS